MTTIDNVEKAIEFFAHRRTQDLKGALQAVSGISQQRFLHYLFASQVSMC